MSKLNVGRRGFMALTAASLVAAQDAAPTAKVFEVASIKPVAAGDNRVMVQITPGGRYSGKNINVNMLLQQAYDVRPFQITGGPSWIATDRFEITAKADGEIARDGMKPLMQSLLQDRFKLKFHKETKEAPIYALVVGKNGHKMKAAEGDRGMMRMGRGQITAQQIGMASLVNSLSNQLGRIVIDKTGLTGSFDFELNWTPDETQTGGGPFAGAGQPPPPPSDPNGPSLVTAIQEQLGLKLESQKGPVPLFIIDSIEKPSEN